MSVAETEVEHEVGEYPGPLVRIREPGGVNVDRTVG